MKIKIKTTTTEGIYIMNFQMIEILSRGGKWLRGEQGYREVGGYVMDLVVNHMDIFLG